jgi:hypothetical protein
MMLTWHWQSSNTVAAVCETQRAATAVLRTFFNVQLQESLVYLQACQTPNQVGLTDDNPVL